MAHRDLTLAYNRLRSAFHRRAPINENLGGAEFEHPQATVISGSNRRLALAGGNLLHNDASGTVDPHMLGNVNSVSPAYVEMVTEINGEVANIATMSEWGCSSAPEKPVRYVPPRSSCHSQWKS